MKTPEQISEWLRYQPWLPRFMQHCRYIGRIKKQQAEDILKGKFGANTIRAGFTWTRTPERVGFWRKINNDFLHWYHGTEE